MESNETLTQEPQAGQVSTPQATEPKDEQNKFKQEEKDLAARFGVEPKLVRLLNEIVEKRLQRLNECLEQLQLLNKNIDGRLVAPKQTAADPEQEEESQPTTGIHYLDELIQSATHSEIAMAYTCLEASGINKKLGDKLSATLRSSVKELLDGYRKGEWQGDVECEVMPAIRLLSFLKGLEASSDIFETELRESAKEEKQPVSQTATEEPQAIEPEDAEAGPATKKTQAEELKEAASEDVEPEIESYGFDPKERVRAYEAFEQWLNNRTLDEKRAALALSMLLSKQQYLPDERIGNRLYKQWRDEVLSVSDLDQLQLKGVPGNEAFCQGYLTAMIIMDG